MRCGARADVMQVAHHYFENGIAYFTRRINKCISLSKSLARANRHYNGV